MVKDNNFYNKESSIYSQKRYPEKESYFVHFLFKKRLRILFGILDDITKSKKDLSLLEVGCADGYVLQEVFGNTKSFGKALGVDISSGMINIATQNNKERNIQFILRGEEKKDFKFDVVLEVGVLNLVNLDKEFEYILSNLKEDGYYICSIASRTSLFNKLKPGSDEDFNHFSAFTDYEDEIEKHFVIEKKIAYGLFIPKIWQVPILGRPIQIFTEFVLDKISPNLFHEKLYVLKKKTNKKTHEK